MFKITNKNPHMEKGSLAHQEFSRCVAASGNTKLLELVFDDLDNPRYPVFYKGQKLKNFSSTEVIGLKLIYSTWNSTTTYDLSMSELMHLSLPERQKLADFLTSK